MSVEFDMATAFILINTDVAAEEEVMEQLKSIAEVKSVHLVYGIYDLIVQIEADDLDTLKKGVTENLRSIEKIRSTMTMIAVE
jgi:DNA-binding Lrp family transcriptional regulator